jgi:hypothetical protein
VAQFQGEELRPIYVLDAFQQPLHEKVLNNINKETKSMRKESKIVTILI